MRALPRQAPGILKHIRWSIALANNLNDGLDGLVESRSSYPANSNFRIQIKRLSSNAIESLSQRVKAVALYSIVSASMFRLGANPTLDALTSFDRMFVRRQVVLNINELGNFRRAHNLFCRSRVQYFSSNRTKKQELFLSNKSSPYTPIFQR